MIYDLYVGQGNNTDALDHLTIRETKSYCLNAFGGYTLLAGEGGWRNGTTDMEEPVHIWRIFSHDRAAVRRFRDWLKAGMSVEQCRGMIDRGEHLERPPL